MNWMKYREMLLSNIEEKQSNLNHAEKIVAQARAELNSSERALASFDEMMDEKLGGMK